MNTGSLKMIKLTLQERQELKGIFMSLWHEVGEGYNRDTMTAEVADLWYNAVCTYLRVTENRLKEGNNSAEDTKNDDPTMS
jgi:hypothetical protein